MDLSCHPDCIAYGVSLNGIFSTAVCKASCINLRQQVCLALIDSCTEHVLLASLADTTVLHAFAGLVCHEQQLYSASEDGSARAWDLRSMQEAHR